MIHRLEISTGDTLLIRDYTTEQEAREAANAFNEFVDKEAYFVLCSVEQVDDWSGLTIVKENEDDPEIVLDEVDPQA